MGPSLYTWDKGAIKSGGEVPYKKNPDPDLRSEMSWAGSYNMMMTQKIASLLELYIQGDVVYGSQIRILKNRYLIRPESDVKGLK